MARGALLGALLGAAHGTKGLQGWPLEGLLAGKEIAAEADALIAS